MGLEVFIVGGEMDLSIIILTIDRVSNTKVHSTRILILLADAHPTDGVVIRIRSLGFLARP